MSNVSERIERLPPLQRALLALEEAQAKIDALRQGRDEPIAVVGVGCRFPGGADGPRAYWELLRDGRNGIREVPPDRWDADALYDPDPDAPGKTYARHGGFIDDVDRFDAQMFSITPREAEFMDPQQRVLLEVAWEALEHAGIAPDRLAGTSTGVFVGISTTDYIQRGQKHCDARVITPYVGTGSAHSIAANRLSYVLGVDGPSMAVDTACSSSLVAAHLAAASLRARESQLALVGGVNLMLLPETTINFSTARMLAPDGRCKAFDARADGYVRGEGCGIVVLKRLSDAEADGDRVLAVIRGSAVNQDGRSNGLTAPHGPSQEAVIARALAEARVSPAEVGYVEAHGTGTPLGDPIELAALARVLSRGRDRSRRALVGSAKTNLGHLEAAAGMAGLIKAVLALAHGEVPPHLNFERPSPHVDWEELPLRVPTAVTPFPEGRRIAGVSSFGFGGTNAHVVLEAGREREHREAEAGRPALIVKLAARGEEALAASARQLHEHLDGDAAIPLAAVAREACVGRADLPDRAAVVASSRDELLAGLAAVAAAQEVRTVARGRAPSGARPKVAFVIPGQGSRYGGAAAALYRHEPAAARKLDELAEVLGSVDELPLAALLEPGDDADRALRRTEVAQPALYALALALAAWWEAAGLRPDAVAGHSVGAYAAAAIAGTFSPADGAGLVAARGRIMSELPSGGGMAALIAAPDAVAGMLAARPELSIAARNGPTETVVAGPAEALDQLCRDVSDEGVRTRRLEVEYAFHSPLVAPALPALEHQLAGVQLAPPRRKLVSDTTGALAGEACATPGYWLRHAREPVDFAAALDTLAGLGCERLVELGPASTLLALAARHPATHEAVGLPSLSSRVAPSVQLLSSLGRVWATGGAVDWAEVAPPGTRKVDLPTYPFQRRRHWLPEPAGPAAQPEREPEPEPTVASSERRDAVASMLGRPPGELRPALVAHVRDEVRRVIGLERAEPLRSDQGLFELGLDSLMAVRLQVALQDSLGLELRTTLAFDHPTIDALADHLLEQLGDTSSRTRRRRRRRSRPAADEPVAIVGMSCRFPGAPDLDAFWELLRDGVDAVVPVPPERWDADAFFDPDPDAPMRMNTRSGGFLAGAVDAFDADMFGISPREATSMDPQQRLLLEVAWEALEDAGMAGALAGSPTGVFVGINTSDYMQLISAGGAVAIDGYSATGNTFSIAAGRLSYLLGLEGPSLAVDTACSSSLVALHLACQSLRSGESEAAVVGGVNLMLSPGTSIGMSKLRALSPDGRCKAFDAAADGYGRGEGCGVIVLKTLADAIEARDRVWAVVRGSAANQDGRGAGLTVPNGPSQEAVIRDALEQAGIDCARVSYVEAHGTGTPLGDPIELQALGNALGGGRSRPLLVGSVKTNFGHLEAAAGVAGVIKVALAMRNRRIPAHLHLRTPNPYVPWDELPIEVPAETVEWLNGDGPRIAGVSSFGFSGTNAHVVVEEPRAGPAPAGLEEAGAGPAARADLLLVSARSEPALRAAAERYGEMLSRPLECSFEDVCFSAATRRQHHGHRLALVAGSGADARHRLAAFANGGAAQGVSTGTAASDDVPVVFVFCGQGALWDGMARDLLDQEPAFRAAVERCDSLVRDAAGWSLLDELRRPRRLDETEVAQPLVFAIQVALAELWQDWGVQPSAVVGHSVGEVAAAHVAGALTLEDAVRVVVARGRVMAPAKGHGAMAALGLPADEAARLIEPIGDQISVAALNAPSTTVVAGAPVAVAAALAMARERQAFTRRLPGDYAFHSRQMASLRQPFADAIRWLEPRAAAVPMFSTVTGAPVGEGDLGPEHWAAGVAQPVRFQQALDSATAAPSGAVLEIGPQPALAGAIRSCIGARGRHDAVLASMRRDAADERAVMLDALGAMHVLGRPIDHHRRFGPGARATTLPAYPWQRRRYWIPQARFDRPDGPGRRTVRDHAGGYALVQRRMDSMRDPGVRLFEADLDADVHSYLGEQRVADVAIVQAGVVLDAVLAAARSVSPSKAVVLRDVELGQPALLPTEPGAGLQVALSADGSFEVHVRAGNRTQQVARGLLDTDARPDPALHVARDVLVPLSALDASPGGGVHVAHPSLLEAALRLGEDGRLPTGAQELIVHGHLPDRVWAGRDGDCVVLADGSGRVLARVAGLRHAEPSPVLLREVAGRKLRELSYDVAWQPRPRPAATVEASDPGSWVVLGDAGGLGERVAEEIKARGHVSRHVRGLEPGAAAGVLGGIRDAPLRGVVHLLGINDEVAAAPRQCAILLELVQSLIAREQHEAGQPPARLWIATRGIQPAGATPPDPEGAPLWGLARVVALEHPELFGGIVDLDPACGREEAALLVDELLGPDVEDQLALRDGERYAPRLVRAPIEPVAGELRLRADASYLVTGGRGALGLKVAAWLAERGARHLILTGRRPPGEAAQGVAAALEEAGVTVHAPLADVADPAAMEALLSAAETRWPPIRGIVHAAGLFHPQAIAEITNDDLAAVLAPKVAGTRILHELTRDAELDFFVMFSSAASVWGSALAGHYVAANHYQDLMAHHRQALGLPALAVNWGWWDGSDMVPEEAKAYFGALGLDVLPESLGFAALEHLMLSGCAQRTIAPVDWRRFKAAYSAKRRRPLLDTIELPDDPDAELAKSAEGRALIAHLELAPAGLRRELAVDWLQAEVGAVLGRAASEPIDPELGFFDAGMDSITTVELKTRIESGLGIDLPATVAFEYPTVTALAGYLVDEVLELAVPAEAESPRPPQRTNGGAPPGAFDRLSEDELLELLATEVEAER